MEDLDHRQNGRIQFKLSQPSKEQKSYNLNKKANQQRPDQGRPYVGIIRHLKAVIKT